MFCHFAEWIRASRNNPSVERRIGRQPTSVYRFANRKYTTSVRLYRNETRAESNDGREREMRTAMSSTAGTSLNIHPFLRSLMIGENWMSLASKNEYKQRAAYRLRMLIVTLQSICLILFEVCSHSSFISKWKQALSSFFLSIFRWPFREFHW